MDSMNSNWRGAGIVCFAILAFTALPAAAGTALVYVTNSAGDSIHVIDPATNKVVQEIKGIEAAHGIAPSPDGARVYVSNEADTTLDVFDRTSGALIKKVPLSNHPNNIAVTKTGDRILVGIARAPGSRAMPTTMRPSLATAILLGWALSATFLVSRPLRRSKTSSVESASLLT